MNKSNTAKERIETLPLYGAKPGVVLAGELLDAAGHPEESVSLIHIAGTNGKGTTAAYTAAILTEAGYKVGLYTSPHLCDIRERIRIDGAMIDEARFEALGGRVLSFVTEDAPTFSDVVFVMALLYFAEESCDYAVIETGLGGTLDSTNAIKNVPVVTAITRIGVDHTALLGKSLAAIAGEKAGIIKAGTKLLIADMDEEAHRVIETRAKMLGVPVVRVEEDVSGGISVMRSITPLQAGMAEGSSAYGLSERFRNSYLYSNAANAAGITSLILTGQAWKKACVPGIIHTSTPGRLEVLGNNPEIIFDGAHNPQGAGALAETLLRWYPGEQHIFLIGMFARPDAAQMLDAMRPAVKEVFAADIPHERNYGAKKIAAYFKEHGIAVENRDVFEDTGDTDAAAVFLAAKQRAKETGLRLIVCGSLHLYEAVRAGNGGVGDKSEECNGK